MDVRTTQNVKRSSEKAEESVCATGKKPEGGAARSLGAQMRSLGALEAIARTSDSAFALIGYWFALVQYFLAAPPFLPFTPCPCMVEFCSLVFDCMRLMYTPSLRI